MKGFVCINLTDAQRARLEAGTDIALAYHPQEDARARAALAASEVAFGNMPAEWLYDAPKLRWHQLESVGFGEYAALDWAKLSSQLKISNLKGFFADPVAESIVAGILSLYRGIDTLTHLQAKGEWVGDALRPQLRLLKNATVVLFGHGDINHRVEELLKPFACTVTAFAREWEAAHLELALAKADVVVCAVPHTPRTAGLFNAARIGKLKPGAILVNFGRGSLVDEGALADALASGQLGGAVIDVTQDEPLPKSHNFWRCPRLILTQHTGGGSSDEIDRKIDVFLSNLARYRKGETPSGLIDLQRGY